MNRRQFLAGSVGTLFAGTAWATQSEVLKNAGFRNAADWDAVYQARWGKLGTHTKQQIDYIVHARNGIYDDGEGPFAWLLHYWLRAFARMADWTGDERYLSAGLSLIDYVFDHTDENRIRRGEIAENYIREPAGFQGSGRGGPFWMRNNEANALNTGQIAHGIMRFVDTVLENEHRWPAYAILARQYIQGVKRAIDPFDADWKNFDDAGSYYYRDSGGSNVLGSTETAFNQSATMCAAHLLVDKWEPDPARREKAERLTRYWVSRYANFRDDGTVTWPYIIHDDYPEVEDTGHASVDLDFLMLAHRRGTGVIGEKEIAALTKTFKTKIWNRDGTLNELVDGNSETPGGFNDHYNIGFGWFELAEHDPEILKMALKTFSRFYPANAPGGVIWARPMLGWANILSSLEN